MFGKAAVAFVVERRLAPLVVGADPRQVGGLWSRMRDATYWDGNGGLVTFGISAVDMALWDLAGKAAGLPLHALLGGKRRDRLPACASTIFATDDLDRIGREFRGFVAEGYRFVKGGWGHDLSMAFGSDERRDRAIARTVREAFAGPLTPGDFLDGLSPPAGTLQQYWQINKGVTRDFLADQFATTQRFFYPQQSFSVSEKVYGGYVMGNLKGEGWRGNVGVRWVQTEQTSDANVTPGGSIENPFGNYDPISVDHDYDDILPSVNLAFDLTDRVSVEADGAYLGRGGSDGLSANASLLVNLAAGDRGTVPYVAVGAGLYRASFDLDHDRFFGRLTGNFPAGTQMIPISGTHAFGMMQGPYSGPPVWTGPWRISWKSACTWTRPSATRTPATS